MHTHQHVLDNPVWNAMISGNKPLAQGTDTVKLFPKDVSPIAGLQEFTTANFNALYDLTSSDGAVLLFSVHNNIAIPETWNVLPPLAGLQMVYTGVKLPAMQENEQVVSLTDEHIPEMLTLTHLTNPGPFSSGTIRFGNYEGIFNNGKLIAIAGQRLHPSPFVEISAVCTHPDYTGKGYARQLLLRQMHQIIAKSGVPFLHVKEDNITAINVYKKLGFEIRKSISFFLLRKKR